MKSRAEWTLEVMNFGVKYRMRGGGRKKKRKEKQLANTKRQPPTYASEALIENLSFFLLNTVLIFVVGSSCPGCMPFG